MQRHHRVSGFARIVQAVQRVPRAAGRLLVALLVCGLLVPVAHVALDVEARAAGEQIWASYVEVDAKSDAAIAGANKCADIPMQQIAPFNTESEDQLPGPQKNGLCSFVSAHYVYGGVDLPLTALTIEGDQVVVTPEVPQYLAQTQPQVKLTIPLATLSTKPASASDARIVLHYADTSTFRRVSLALSANSTKEPGQSQADINLDGTQFTTGRRMFLYRETRNGRQVFARTVDIDVPRLRELTWTKGSDAQSQKLSFVETADTSTKYRTQKKFDIIFDDTVNVSAVTLSATLLSQKFDRVNMHGDLHIDEDMYKEVVGDVGSFDPWYQQTEDCGGGTCGATYYDNIQEPFFYKVTSSLNKDKNDRDYAANQRDKKGRRAVKDYDAIYHRTEILAPPFYQGTREGGETYLMQPKRGGYEHKHFQHYEKGDARLIDFRQTAPLPVKTGIDRTLAQIDTHESVASEWPTFEAPGASGKFTVLDAPDVGRNYVDDPHSDTQSTVSFYVQFNGVPLRRTRGVGWENRDHWSYFLSRLGINGEWLDVPFPQIPSKPFGTKTYMRACHGGGLETDCFSEDYELERMGHILGVDAPLAHYDQNLQWGTLTADMYYDGNEGIFRYTQYGVDTPPNGTSGLYNQFVVKPRQLRSYTFDRGVNAGMKVDVELVNARVQGDALADGFSALTATVDSWYADKRKKASRGDRHAASPSIGPATQMTNTSPGWWAGGIATSNRTQAMWNQWKTLYKVTISGMYVKNLEFTAKYDYTSKSKMWNAGSDPAEKVEVKEGRIRRSTLEGPVQWRDRSFVGGVDPECVRQNLGKCDGAIAQDLPRVGETSDGNIRFTLKDGYINPQLWAFKNRTQSAVCDGTSEDCQLVSRQGGTFSYLWIFNNKNAYDRADDSVASHFKTETARPFRVEATTVNTPMVVMKSSAAGNPMVTHDAATAQTAAPAAVMPDQWSGEEFTPQYRNKTTSYFYALSGSVPPAENGRAFTGYYLQGLTSDGRVEPLLKDRYFYPGDAIDLRNATGADGQGVRISNDAYNGPRYKELQLVPTFGALDTGRPRTYLAQRYLVDTGRPSGDPVPFYAAPGLTVTKTDAMTTEPITDGDITYEYTSDKPTVASWEVTGQEDSNSPILRLIYLDPTKTLVLTGAVNPITGAVTETPNLWSTANLNAWLNADSSAPADYTTVLASADTRLVVPSGENKQDDQQVMNGRANLPISWTATDEAESAHLTADPWICGQQAGTTAPSTGPAAPVAAAAATPTATGTEQPAGTEGNLATADPTDANRATVALVAGKVIECRVTFHSAQLGVTAFGLDYGTGTKNVFLVPTDAPGEKVTLGATPEDWTNESTWEGATVKPGTTWTLTAPEFLGGKYLAGWKRYKGDFTAGSYNNQDNWEDVTGTTITARPDMHDIYAPVYKTPLMPWLPRTGGSAALTWLIIGGALTAVALAGMALVRRRRATA